MAQFFRRMKRMTSFISLIDIELVYSSTLDYMSYASKSLPHLHICSFFATCDHVSMMFNLVALKYNGRAAINSLVLAFNCRSYFLYHRYIYLFIYIHNTYICIYSLIMIIPSKALRIYTLTIF